MIKKLFSVFGLLLLGVLSQAQEIKFQEYDLPNGMHVILHQDNKAPVVATAVMYHVGAKDEIENRTGFAHFFEHLLFEGTPNIKRGEWMKIVAANGGTNNANTTDDRTYYYETFPSNNLQLGLWMEAERLRHPVINEIGVKTQNEVVKEEKRLSYDSRPYGGILKAIKTGLFKNHPYKNTTIGEMEDLDSAKLEEFKTFFKKYYIPNNATLVVAGDINVDETKKLIDTYFASIPKGTPVVRDLPKEDPITKETLMTAYDKNIQLPAYLYTYRTPSDKTRDSKVLDMISSYLSNGKSSVLYKKLVDEEKKALAVQAINLGEEDYSVFAFFAIPMGTTTEATLRADIDAEIKKLQTNLINEEDYQKLQNQFENQFVNANSNIQGIASSLATYHVLQGNTDLINKDIEVYRSITREDIRNVAKTYLNSNQRVIINYLPEKK
jgi:zinc protease